MNFTTYFALCTIATLAMSHLSEAKDLCDPGLTGSSNSPMGYTMRGDRCEGIYALQVNSTDVRLASLVEAFSFDSQDDTPLTVQWPVIAGHAGSVRLRAQSLRPRSYYRMDTVTADAASNYAWPAEILGALGLQRNEVGVLGWFEHEIGRERRDVYLPLRIAQGGAQAPSTEYEVALVPDIRLREVSVSLTPLDREGVEGEPVIDRKPLEYGYYPAKEATVFQLPKPDSPGFYKLELICERMPSGIATTTFFFYHSE